MKNKSLAKKGKKGQIVDFGKIENLDRLLKSLCAN